MADPYRTLGVNKSASEAEIKAAYRKLAKQWHPDKNTGNPKAAERFSEAAAAYDLLGDPARRAAFDRGEIDADGNPAMPFGYGGSAGRRGPQTGGFGGGGGVGGEAADLSDLFEGLFGGRGGGPFGGGGSGAGRGAPPPRGANRAYRLAVSFVDAATCAPQRITLADGQTIDVKLPAGVESGIQMRLTGKGDAGPGGRGDAIVTIEVGAHPFFVRDGINIRIDVPVTLAEAVLGAKVRVPTPDGAVMLSVPAGSSSGRQMRLKGKGWSGKDSARGDLLVRLLVDLPAGDAALVEFAAGWRDGRNVREGLGG